MIVVFVGAPGSGKGTQAERLARKMDYIHFSTGEALRSEIKKESPLGKKAKNLVNNGKLVDDETLLAIVSSQLDEHRQQKHRVLLDGYPRNIKQARDLDLLGAQYPVDLVIHIDVNEDEIVKRLGGRRVCENCQKVYHVIYNPPQDQGVCDSCGSHIIRRLDDSDEKIVRRLAIFKEDTEPMFAFYRNSGKYHVVDGVGDPDRISQEIADLIENVS